MTNRTAGRPGAITIYSTSWCPWCDRAKALFDARGAAYTDVNIELWDDPREELESLTGRRTVPQIFIGETHVGGFDDLVALDADGTLAGLFQAESVAARV